MWLFWIPCLSYCWLRLSPIFWTFLSFPHLQKAVFEDVPLGTVILRVKATDADSGHFALIEYSLGDGEGKFGINPNTVRDKLRLEQHCKYMKVVGTRVTSLLPTLTWEWPAAKRMPSRVQTWWCFTWEIWGVEDPWNLPFPFSSQASRRGVSPSLLWSSYFCYTNCLI